MSGHSKWSTIKHQKGATDAARAQIFTKLANAITIAVRAGGGIADPGDNIKLRLAIEKARAANMPKANIERAIDRATGKLIGAAQLEEIIYEGFGPGGAAVLVEAVTDNKQRTAAAIKNSFAKHGGSLGSSGSVAYLFEKVGTITVNKTTTPDSQLEAIMESGATDFTETETEYALFTQPKDLHQIKSELEKRGFTIVENELTFKPTTTVTIGETSGKAALLALFEVLEQLEDVHKVHTNAEIIHS